MYTAKIFIFIILFMLVTAGVVALIFILLAVVGLRTIFAGLFKVPTALMLSLQAVHN